MSVADILEKHGSWIRGKEFCSQVASKLGKSDRQAYRLIKSAEDEKEIRKIILPDRTTVYGLPNWPLGNISKSGRDRGPQTRPLSKAEREERERLSEFYATSEFVAEAFPEFEPLKRYAEIHRRIRKELGLE